MPIYAYRCAQCGHSKDVLQKISDPVLSICPVCQSNRFEKQLTAAGFQLKGSGWYATDFRDSGQNKQEQQTTKNNKAKDDKSTESSTDASSVSATPASPDTAPKATTPSTQVTSSTTPVAASPSSST